MMKSILFIGIFFFLINIIISSDCPPLKDIEPCVCEVYPKGPHLFCENIVETEVLERVFRNATGYDFARLEIYKSTLKYLPNETLESLSPPALYIRMSTLLELFQTPPKNLSKMSKIFLQNTTFIKGTNWDFLESMTNLKELQLYDTRIKIITDDFSKYASDSIKIINFDTCMVKSIKPGAFKKCVNLDIFQLKFGDLREIRRDIFPDTFSSLSEINLDGNKLQSLPDGMFTNMENLQHVYLSKNNLTTINSAAFNGTAKNLLVLRVKDNPIECDCGIDWLRMNPPMLLEGTCAGPPKLTGKSLDRLTAHDLKC